MLHPGRTLLTAAAFVVVVAFRPCRAAEAAPSAEQVRFFEAEVRPVLVEHCAKCHGANKPKGNLRLDSRAGLLAGGDTGPAVVPGKPDESLLVEAVEYKGPEMPPKGRLPKEKVAALTKWVEMGAPWPASEEVGAAPVRRGPLRVTDKDRQHWAFRPIVAPALPSLKQGITPTNPIDAFVQSRLEAKGLQANGPAPRQELIRRAYYDLTGLPPTPEEVDAFVNDPSPNAYDALIDRLLDSPHYGEKWGRHWLDLVRFAETNSYERDNPKPNAWRYRDYVIRAFNDDKPFDRFVREQLAGDELPDRNDDAWIATGYYRLGIWDDEPSDREQARYDSLDDIVATTGQVFLGLTVDCARCHDHKLDPIPQTDYYRLLAFFQNIQQFRNGGPTDEAVLDTGGERAAYEQAVRERDRKRNEIQSDLSEIEHEFLAQQAANASKVRAASIDGLRYRYFRDTWERLPDFDALKPEETGSLASGLFDLAPRSRDTAFGFVFEGDLIVPNDGEYTFHVDSDDGSRLTVAGRVVATHDGIHGLGEGKTASVRLAKGRVPIRLDYFQRGNGLGLRVAWSGPGVPLRPLSASEKHEDAPGGSLAQLIREAGAAVLGPERLERYRRLGRELQRLNDQPVPAERALCVTETGPRAPETFVLIRGNPHVPGDKVGPGFPEVLTGSSPVIPTPDPGAKTSGRRRVLADWIASPENPLTARVLANRLWQHHFGRGIVRSPNNFGVQGDKPTHPELLDWLAAELIRGGWRLKPLHRLIMTSAAYQRSSRALPEALAQDPVNDLLWRFDMRRLTGEEIRDSVLAVTGALNPKMYGPGIFVEIPPEVLAGQSIPGKGWGRSPADEQARRSVYIHVKRSLVTPILESFDLAETDRSSPVRFSTTQPTQALGMLNGTFANQQAARFADRVQHEAGPALDKQVARALALVTQRTPTAAEVRRGIALIQSLRFDAGASPEAALRTFCLVALNLNEFIYLD